MSSAPGNRWDRPVGRDTVGRDTESSGGRRRVVIVGGGLAGLSAAEALSRQDGDRFHVILLEAKRSTGGRAGSFTEPVSGEVIDYCQHVAMGCCTNLLGLLQRCGLADSLQRYSELEFHHPRHAKSDFAASKYLPAPLHLASSIGSLRYLTATEKRQVRTALWRLMRTPSDSLRSQSAGDWLRQQRQSANAVRLFWDVVLVSALGQSSDTASMSVARKVFIDGFAAARGASDVFVPKRPLSELFGQSLTAEIGKLGAEIHSSAAVKRLHLDGPSMVKVETSSGQQFAADHLISAVPWHTVNSLVEQIEPLSLAAFEKIRSSPITGLHLWFDREITDRPHAVMVGTLSQWLFRQPYRDDSSSSNCYYQVVISASGQQRDWSRDELVAAVVDELKHALPAARDATLVRSRVVTDPQAVFSVSPEVEAIRPNSRTPLPWFHLAGDWIATGWPATMEGAVISGRMAAASVLESEGGGAIPIDEGLPRNWLARLLIKA